MYEDGKKQGEGKERMLSKRQGRGVYVVDARRKGEEKKRRQR